MRQRKGDGAAGSHPLYLRAVAKVGAAVADLAASLAGQRWRWRKAALRSLPRDASRDLADALAEFANSATGVAWPSQATLAARIGVTERTVRTALRTIEAAGYARSVRVGKRETLLVFLTLPTAAQAESDKAPASATTGNPATSTTGSPLPPILKREPKERTFPSELVAEGEPDPVSAEPKVFSFDGKEEPSPDSASPCSTVEQQKVERPGGDPMIGERFFSIDGHDAAVLLEHVALRLVGAPPPPAARTELVAFGEAMTARIALARRIKDALGRHRWTELGRAVQARQLRESDLAFALAEAGLGRAAA